MKTIINDFSNVEYINRCNKKGWGCGYLIVAYYKHYERKHITRFYK